jgi:hypothetical protein
MWKKKSEIRISKSETNSKSQKPKKPKKPNRKNFDELVKNQNSMEFIIPANPGSSPGQAPESSYFKMSWTPACAGVTIQETFCENINF